MKKEGYQVSKKFEKYAKKVQEIPKKPTDDELLQLYGLFKQTKFGDNTTEKPSIFTLNLKAHSKWGAWNKNKGMTQENSEKEYILLCKKIIKKYMEE